MSRRRGFLAFRGFGILGFRALGGSPGPKGSGFRVQEQGQGFLGRCFGVYEAPGFRGLGLRA